MNVNPELGPQIKCPKPPKSCDGKSSDCIGPVVIREYNEIGRVLHRELACSLTATARLKLQPISGGGHPDSISGRDPTTFDVCEALLTQYISNVELDFGVTTVEAHSLSQPNNNNQPSSIRFV